MKQDTNFFRILGPLTVLEFMPETIHLTGQTDGIKGSNLEGVRIANKLFTGTVRENCIDLVRGSDAIIGPNVYQACCGVAEITVKGGFNGLHLERNFGTLEWGQYSNYDRWFALPKSKNLTFGHDATGTVIVWYAEKPTFVPAGVKIVDRRWLAYPYFLWRSIVQQIQVWLKI